MRSPIGTFANVRKDHIAKSKTNAAWMNTIFGMGFTLGGLFLRGDVRSGMIVRSYWYYFMLVWGCPFLGDGTGIVRGCRHGNAGIETGCVSGSFARCEDTVSDSQSPNRIGTRDSGAVALLSSSARDQMANIKPIHTHKHLVYASDRERMILRFLLAILGRSPYYMAENFSIFVPSKKRFQKQR